MKKKTLSLQIYNECITRITIQAQKLHNLAICVKRLCFVFTDKMTLSLIQLVYSEEERLPSILYIYD